MEKEIFEENVTEKTDKYEFRIWPIIGGIIFTLIMAYFEVDREIYIWLWAANITILLDGIFESSLINSILKIGSLVLAIILILNLNDEYYEYKYVNMVKETRFEDTTYEEMFDDFSTDAEWDCISTDRFTQISLYESDRYSGGFIGKVTVSGSCYFYETETNYMLTFYITESKKEIIPYSLTVGSENISSSYMIEAFLQRVYEYTNSY